MEAIDGISKGFLALLARQLAQEQDQEQEQEQEQDQEEMPSLQTKMEELVSVNQSLLEALDLSHPALQQVQIIEFNISFQQTYFANHLPESPTGVEQAKKLWSDGEADRGRRRRIRICPRPTRSNTRATIDCNTDCSS